MLARFDSISSLEASWAALAASAAVLGLREFRLGLIDQGRLDAQFLDHFRNIQLEIRSPFFT